MAAMLEEYGLTNCKWCGYDGMTDDEHDFVHSLLYYYYTSRTARKAEKHPSL